MNRAAPTLTFPKLPWLASLLLLGISVSGLRASPRDELLRFVPKDMAFCLVFQDLRARWAALDASPFAEHLRKAPLPLPTLGTEELEKIKRAQKMLSERLGLDWPKLRDDILGESLVFAYRPGPPDKPEKEMGLILLRSANARTLADLIERFNKSQKESGVLDKLEERQHNGVKYVCRVEKRQDKQQTTYYLLRGPVLVLSSQEEMLKQALDQERALAADAEPALASQLKQLAADRALMALWINPRAFDETVDARVAQAPPTEAVAAQTFQKCWKALDGVALSLHLERDLVLVLGVRGRLEELPEPTRRFLTEAGRPSELWRLFPEDALLALSGRIDLPALMGTVSEFLAPEQRKSLEAFNQKIGAALHLDLARQLSHLGPNFGFCLTAPPAQEKEPSWLPQGLLALRIEPGNPAAPTDKTVFAALKSLAQLGVLLNSQALELKSLEDVQPEVCYISGDGVFPPGVRPAFGLQHGYLVLASSPEVIQRFAQAKPANPSLPERGVPLLRVSFKAWRTYLNTHRDNLARAMLAGKEKGLTADEARKRIDDLTGSLRLLDRLELRQLTSKDKVVLTLSLQPIAPLQK